MWAAGYPSFRQSRYRDLSRKSAPLSVSFASSEGTKANACIPTKGWLPVTSTGFVCGSPVEQRRGGDAKLTLDFPQSNVLNQAGES